jgi:hypothetical protein
MRIMLLGQRDHAAAQYSTVQYSDVQCSTVLSYAVNKFRELSSCYLRLDLKAL